MTTDARQQALDTVRTHLNAAVDEARALGLDENDLRALLADYAMNLSAALVAQDDMPPAVFLRYALQAHQRETRAWQRRKDAN